jgi:hypothetical protein
MVEACQKAAGENDKADRIMYSLTARELERACPPLQLFTPHPPEFALAQVALSGSATIENGYISHQDPRGVAPICL